MKEKQITPQRRIFGFSGSLFLYQAISSLMTLFMGLGILVFAGNGWWQLILVSGVPSIVIYSMAYLDAWKLGFKTRGAGAGKGSVYLGKLGLDTFIGSVIFELPSVILYLLVIFVGNGNAVGKWSMLFLYIFRMNFYGMFDIFKDSFGWMYIIPFLFLLTPILSTVGYNLGLRDISLIDRLRYGKDN